MSLLFTPQGNTINNYVDGSFTALYVRASKTAMSTITTGSLTADVSYTALNSLTSTTYNNLIGTALGSDTADATWLFLTVGDIESGTLQFTPSPNTIVNQEGSDKKLSTKYECTMSLLQFTASDIDIYETINDTDYVDILVVQDAQFTVYPRLELTFDRNEVYDSTTVLKGTLTGSRTIGRNATGYLAKIGWSSDVPT